MYPTIYYPASGSAVPSTSPTLNWGNKVYVDYMMCTYTVYFGTNPDDLTIIATDLTQDSIKLNGLGLNLAYYWKVTAKYKWGIDCSSTTTTQILSFIPVQTDCPYVITEPVLIHLKTPPRVGGNVLYRGSSPLIERGVFWSQSPNAELNGNKFQIGDRPGLFTALLPGLNPSTTLQMPSLCPADRHLLLQVIVGIKMR